MPKTTLTKRFWLFRFWDWYDDLHGKHDVLRFWIFFGPMIMLIGVIPAVLYWLLSIDITLGQIPGLLIMTILALTKSWRPSSKL